ncbi:MAG: GGDEF domain-containing protein [Vallitaleaceae bacterium]|jgi:diguanylate cyclase (GGDEF)-like protein|nr:GGDEF domain-containing protein [Vallitaleaceae bacterium]
MVIKKRVIFSYLIIIVVGIWVASQTTIPTFLNDENSLSIPADQFTPSLALSRLSDQDSHYHSYEVQLTKDAFKYLDGEAYRIILYKLADNNHKVYFNGQIIGSAGDFIEGNSNLWNGLFTYTLDASLLEEVNTLTITSYTSYQTGLASYPIYISELTTSNHLIAKLIFYGKTAVLLAIGFIAFSSAITLILFLISKNKNRMYLYLSIATTLISIYCMDYIAIDYFSIPYLIYKKLIIAGLVWGIAFLTLAIYKYFNVRLLKYLGIITGTGFLLPLIFTTNMIDFKVAYGFYYLIIIINVLVWLVTTIVNLKKKKSAYIFLMGFLVIGTYGTIAIIFDAFHKFFTLNSPVIYIIVIATLPLMLANEEYLEKDILLDLERALKEKETLNALTDDLTGAWNQRFLFEQMRYKIAAYTMVLIDVDNFKQINDTYGHLAGDYILQRISSLVSSVIRKSDVLCRYGGDEFVLLMHHCDILKAHENMERIRLLVEMEDFVYDQIHINVTMSIGIYLDKKASGFDYIFNMADKQLYHAKTKGKNQIVYATN